MKKIYLAAALAAVMAGTAAAPAYAGLFSKTPAEQLQKAREKQFKEKKKEYKRDGWKLTGTSKSIDVALLEFYEKLNNGENQELVGEVSACKSANVCKQVAFNNAIVAYANLAGSFVRGRVTSDASLNQTDGSGEFDHFYAAYERLVQAEVKNGVIKEGYSVVKDNGDTKEFKTFFIVNEAEASQARMRALDMAAKETKMAQENANKISDFVREGFEFEN
ncbi:MAG: hypothetical protein LBL94_12520 [Prevotellaceae bacterium]|jgi:hypothetical protein|nr:hypothetical protein [Prevotellaceae bacterium]